MGKKKTNKNRERMCMCVCAGGGGGGGGKTGKRTGVTHAPFLAGSFWW